MTYLQTATQQFLYMDSKILFRGCFVALCVWVWFDAVPNLAADIQLDILFIDCFIHGIFPLQKKFVPWYWNLVDFSVLSKTDTVSSSSTTFCKTTIGDTKKINNQIKETPSLIRMVG